MTALSDLLNDAKGDRVVDDLIEAAEKRGHTVDRGTVYRALKGEHAKRPREETMAAFAAVFEIDVRKVREAADLPAGELGPWEPTPEAARLSADQRRALDRLIKTIVQGGQAHGNAAPTKTPPAPDQVTERRKRKYPQPVHEAARPPDPPKDK